MMANMKGGTSGAQTTSGQPDNSELSRFMNNGGGPEPHQGSNPGAQSDPGPKEVGFYDKATEHMGGDDGVRAAVEGPSPMRMGGYDDSGNRNGVVGTVVEQFRAYFSRDRYILVDKGACNIELDRGVSVRKPCSLPNGPVPMAVISSSSPASRGITSNR